MDLAHRLQRSFKPRFAVVYPFAFFVIFFCSLDETSIKSGVFFIIVGLAIRLWSNGYAIKNDKLTTSGPYALVRNPLYVGTFLIAIGFVIVLKSDPRLLELAAGGIFLLALCFMYYRTIHDEQGMLLAKYKDAYKDYCKNVPAMVPCFVPYSKGEKWPFSVERLLKSKEHKTVFWIFILLVVFYLKTLLFIEHQPMTETAWTLSGMALTLVFLDVVYECNKRRF